MAGTSVVEVLGLFAIAALVCWPTLRRYLSMPDRGTETGPSPRSLARFEPKRAAVAPELEGDWLAQAQPGRSNGVLRDCELDDEEVLPLAEALLRGERIAPPLEQPVMPPPAAPLAGPVAATRPPQQPPASPRARAEAPSETPAEPFKVLLVDGRDKFRTTMLLRLARAGHRVFPVARPHEALDVFGRERSDLVLVHRDALRELGDDFPRRLRSTAPHVPILVHGAPRSPGAQNVDCGDRRRELSVLTGAGDDVDVIADMVDCSLAASRAIRRIRDDQQVRGQILSELCYNLRSSLEVISGYTDILSDAPDLSGHLDLLERMRASMNAATVHMQSCVDVAVDAPETARHERVDLSTLTDKIERLVSRQLGGRPLRLATKGPLQGSAIFTDGEKLLAILSHVIVDAVERSPESEINLCVCPLPDRTDFTVSDTATRAASAAAKGVAEAPAPPTPGLADDGVGITIAERLSRTIGATFTGRRGGSALSFTVSVPSKLMQAADRTLH